METAALGKVLGIIQMLIAVWYFYCYGREKSAVAAALFLSGLSMVLDDRDSKFRKRASKLLLYLAVVIAAFLLVNHMS